MPEKMNFENNYKMFQPNFGTEKMHRMKNHNITFDHFISNNIELKRLVLNRSLINI